MFVGCCCKRRKLVNGTHVSIVPSSFQMTNDINIALSFQVLLPFTHKAVDLRQGHVWFSIMILSDDASTARWPSNVTGGHNSRLELSSRHFFWVWVYPSIALISFSIVYAWSVNSLFLPLRRFLSSIRTLTANTWLYWRRTKNTTRWRA